VVRVPAGAGNFSPHHCVQTSSKPHPASYPMGADALSLGREAAHSPPSSVEVKNAWSHTLLPQYAFIAGPSVKTQGQVYLYRTLHIRRVIKLTGVMIEGFNCYQLHTKIYPICFSQG